ncbi:DMT family transporter [Thalassospiraceae bacterium LMO-JJ14]|nr:DMT family transporter [Thalassospiraceae bacterium LMO-JJ14]
MPHRAILIATLWAACATCLFAFMWVLPKFVGQSVPAVQVACLRYAAGAVCIAPFFVAEIVRNVPAQPVEPQKGRLFLLHLARAACGVTSLAFGTYAVTRIPLANVQAIAMTNGVFTVLFAFIFLRERAGWRELLAGAIALCGALIVAGPGTQEAAGWALAGVLAAFAQAITWGGEVVLLRATAARESASRILFKVNAMAALMVFLVGVWFWESLTLDAFLLIAAMGPIAIIGQLCNIRAFRVADATTLVPVRYSGIIFAAIFGLLLFDEWPASSAIVGAAMIVGGAMWLALRKS